MAASGTTSKSDPGLGLTSTDPAESLWDVDYDKADQRIGARRSRIRNRIDMARKIKKMIHVKHIFGYHSSDTKETFPGYFSLCFFLSVQYFELLYFKSLIFSRGPMRC